MLLLVVIDLSLITDVDMFKNKFFKIFFNCKECAHNEKKTEMTQPKFCHHIIILVSTHKHIHKHP